MVRRGVTVVTVLAAIVSCAARGAEESDFYRIDTLPLPEGCVLEVGGLAWLDDGMTRLAACTRRGEVWAIDNVYAEQPTLETLKYKRMLFGLHEPLGLLRRDGWLYAAQRGELTRMKDSDGDDRIDVVEAFCDDWHISGSYHEYAFGPKVDKHGNFVVTLNRPFGGEPEGQAKWRGWAVTIDDKGEMELLCAGIRSPAGLGANAEGEMFYTDNQGDWVAAGKLGHLKPGAFHGNPISTRDMKRPESPIKHPGDLPKAKGTTWGEAVEKYPTLTPPAIWFPNPSMGRSQSDIVCDTTGGKFGPFSNQLFVGDQANSMIVRVFLEKVDGEYQGAVFPFRSGFQCGILRMVFGNDGTMFVGQTSRGWGSRGGRPYGLERLTWTGKTPFEMHELRATPDGFEVTFTQPVDAKTAGDVASYSMKAWTYDYRSSYGCPPLNTYEPKVTKAVVADDRRSVRLTVEDCKPYFVHELRCEGVRNEAGEPLLHADAYYTLNRIPRTPGDE